jgi:hypothetical protein
MKPRSSRPTAVTIFILSLPCPPVSHIDYPVGGDTVTRGKPDPEGFLRGPRCSPVHLTIVLVIEASRAAIRVGRSAGCPVLSVASSHEVAELRQADWIVASLGQIQSSISDAATLKLRFPALTSIHEPWTQDDRRYGRNSQG